MCIRDSIKTNQASALMSNLLPIIHEKIKILMGSASNRKQDVQKENVVKEGTIEEDSVAKKNLFGFKKKEKTVEEETASNEEEDNNSSSAVDKVLMAVIGVFLIAIIGVLIFIVFKVNSLVSYIDTVFGSRVSLLSYFCGII